MTPYLLVHDSVTVKGRLKISLLIICTGVENVINFDLPPTPDDYVHRVGRCVYLYSHVEDQIVSHYYS